MSGVLEVAGLAKSFGGIEAVRGVSFGVAAGEIVAMIGPNGAGKTTCFDLLNGQLAPDAGSVKLQGAEIVGLNVREIARLGVGRTFQITATFASMTVIENVQMALLSHHRRLSDWWTRAADGCLEDARRLLERVGMLDQASRACSVLAYGDLKRVEFAMGLAGDPRLLLMDEPTAGMAQAERGELMTLAAGIARERRIAVLFTEHDMDVVFAHADRIVVLHRGQVIASGKPAEVRAEREVREIYLGSWGTA
jgi:branched-chain amino acid transport system ATP-binding protein